MATVTVRAEGFSMFVVNAFSDQPFGGNPAAVVPLARDAPADWMQAVAGQMNLS